MNEFLAPILEWLSTQHGAGRRPAYGWVIVVLFAFFIATAVGNATQAERRKVRRKTLIASLLKGPVSADLVSDEAGKSIRHFAHLHLEGDAYRLRVVRAEQPLFDAALGSLDEVEAFLIQHTTFVLSDFKTSGAS